MKKNVQLALMLVVLLITQLGAQETGYTAAAKNVQYPLADPVSMGHVYGGFGMSMDRLTSIYRLYENVVSGDCTEGRLRSMMIPMRRVAGKATVVGRRDTHAQVNMNLLMTFSLPVRWIFWSKNKYRRLDSAKCSSTAVVYIRQEGVDNSQMAQKNKKQRVSPLKIAFIYTPRPGGRARPL